MKPIKENGLLITIEGVTGVGKSYFTDKLFNKLIQDSSQNVKKLGGFVKDGDDQISEITKFLRQLMSVNWKIGLPWLCETTLLIAEQAYNVETDVLNSYSEGNIILYENYNDALIAYQLMRGETLDIESDVLFNILNDLVELQYNPFKFPKPDFTVYISAPLDVIYKRLERRENRIVSDNDKITINKIVNNYEKLYYDNKNIIRIENDHDTNIDEVVENLIAKDFHNFITT